MVTWELNGYILNDMTLNKQIKRFKRTEEQLEELQNKFIADKNRQLKELKLRGETIVQSPTAFDPLKSTSMFRFGSHDKNTISLP